MNELSLQRPQCRTEDTNPTDISRQAGANHRLLTCRLLDGLFCVSSNRNCTGDGETSLKSRSPFYAPGLIM